ncbi:MAG: ester cyclase [Amaricoccus sp.]
MGTLDAVHRYFGAWIRRDADAVLASLTDDGTYEDPTTAGPIGGAALRQNLAGLWGAFPDLGFEIESLAETGPERAAAQWIMTGTNSGSLAGLPPTGQSVRLRGADFFVLADERVRSVTGYFDSAGAPRQVGLDVIVQPSRIGPFRFGVATMVQTGKTRVPGAFTITSLEARDAEARQTIRMQARDALRDMLGMEGFIGATTATVGLTMVTVSAWDSPEDSRRVMKEGAHSQVMGGLYDGSLATTGFNSVWTLHRMNPVHVRCPSCGRMARSPEPDEACRCGAPLPDPRPYW